MKPVTLAELSEKYNICLGITPWKRRNFLTFVGGRKNARFRALRDFHEAVVEAKIRGGRIIAWASSAPTGLFEIAHQQGVELFLVEDGFIRSSGLGIKLNMPASLCFSREGIHYDARYPSNLERFLQSHEFSDEERSAGDRLASVLKEKRITKYNLTSDRTEVVWPKGTGKKILVIGQVGDDASLKYGSFWVRSNQDLLASVRERCPTGRILFRPHPDVTSGLRTGAVNDEDLYAVRAMSSSEGDLIDTIISADEVHVASSQTGLEACLYGARVVCYGQPFYSGWGLTEDVHDMPHYRRGRYLTLSELLYAVFIAYPCYVNPYSHQSSDVFEIIDLIDSEEEWPRAPKFYILAVWLKRRGISRRALKDLLAGLLFGRGENARGPQ